MFCCEMRKKEGWSCLWQPQVRGGLDEELPRLPVHDDQLLRTAAITRTEQQQQLNSNRSLTAAAAKQQQKLNSSRSLTATAA
jgi:hypothetical protein